MTMTELFDYGRRILAQQPFSVLLGAELTRFEPGEAELILHIRDALKQQHGFVHGGVISYLADNSLAFVGGSVLTDVVTSEYKINYVRPAIGEQLVARASVLASGKRQAVCQAEVYVVADGQERLVAVAQGTLSKVDS
ncbi:phenylacetic acid degradation protein PaaI [Salinisphaera sp. T5B8]